MRRDEILKTASVAAICFLLGAAAYFQAAGVMSLLKISLFEGEDKGGWERKSGAIAGALASVDGGEKSAAAILARNPFDSVTGPLDGMPKKTVHHTDEMALGEGVCEGVRVMLITASEDPAWSFAAVAEGAGRAILRRVGDEIAGMAIDRIDWNFVHFSSPARGGCSIHLGEAAKAGGISKALQNNSKEMAAPGKTGGALSPDLAAKVKRVGDREVLIDRSLISDAMDRQGEVFAKLRIAPVADGVRVTGIRPGSLLALMGMENGDELRSVNGMVISDPKSAMEAYMKLMKADHWVVNVGRRGQPVNLDVKIQ